MRKYFIVLASLAVAGCMVSEISEETVYVNVDYPTYTAAFDDEGTKVYVDTDLKMHWNAGDEISIFRTTGNQRYSFDGADGDREGTFSVQGDPQGGSELQTTYAVYPYSDDTSSSTDGVITLNLPEVQHYAENSFGLGANTMVAVTESKESDKLYFKNLCGYLVVKLYGEGTIKSITLTGNNGEKLSGQATVAPVYGDAPVMTMSESAGTSITLDCGEGVALESTPENATAFWFAVPPVTFTQGFTIEVTDGASCTTNKETSIERTIVRNVINSLQSFQINQSLNQELAVEREALIAIYNALNGDNWTHNDNWCSDKPVNEWYGIETWGELGYVNCINLYNNNLSGKIPQSIGAFINLRELFLNDNHIEGTIPSSLLSLIHLRSIALDNNRISGCIPEGIDQLKELESLSLSMNNLSGSIPNTIGNLSYLRWLNLCWNPLSGAIPESLGNLKNLEYCHLHSCDLTGSIPKSLGDLQKLTDLSIASNKLTGEIPKELGNCSKLEALDISRNMISGSIPKEIGNLNLRPYSVVAFECNENRLYGEIPTSIRNKDYWTYNWANIIHHNMFDVQSLHIPAPAFSGKDIYGNDFSSIECYNNNKLLIIADCTTYSESYINLMSDIYERYHDKGLELLFYSFQTQEDVTTLANQYSLPGRIVSASFIEEYNRGFFDGYDYYPGAFTGFWTLIDAQNKEVLCSSIICEDSELELTIKKALNEGPEGYVSSDYSLDGSVTCIQNSTTGKGLDLIIVGDGFSDRLITDGTYDGERDIAVSAFFSEEPYKSRKYLFNIYSVCAISEREVFDEYRATALRGWFGDGTTCGGSDAKVLYYALKAIPEERIDNAVIIVLMHKDTYAGMCYMYYPEVSGDYGRGLSIAYFPTNSNISTFTGLVSHEAGGHGFAKLADEYAYDYNGRVPGSVLDNAAEYASWGWWKNIDFTGEPTQVKWAQFIADPRYATENIGCYEGAHTYWTGVWRPTENSIMRYNTGGFNAPSRYAIWYRINKLAYGDSWNGTYEDFVEYDAVNRTPAAVARRNARRNCVEKNLPPLAPPVVVGHSWRDAK